jgi:signal transduction histidine kinase
MKRLSVLIITVLLAELAIYAVMDYSRGLRLDDYYRSKVTISENNLKSALSAYEQIFTNVIQQKIDTREVKTLMLKAADEEYNRDIYRNRLRIETQPIFDSLRSIGLSHMQYHMPDGTSLLRMHRPFYYGDSLAPFRKTVMQANHTDKMIQGFENGRHLVAYRYVFPLDMDGDHIGSAEMAVGLKEMIQALNRLYGIGYSYILDKEKVFQNYTAETIDKYLNNSISDTYFMESCDACITSEEYACSQTEIHSKLMTSIVDTNKTRLTEYKPFSEIVHTDCDDILLTYIPVITVDGNGVGYIISHGLVEDYRVIINTYRVLFVSVSMIALSLIIIFAALDNSRRKTLRMNEALERKVTEKVIELQNKDQFLMQQSKMATMGEMVTSILHQWKQPINSISMISDIVLIDIDKKCDDEEIKESLKNIKEQTMFMSQTGADFLNFMKPSKNKTVFNVAEAVEDVIHLFEFSFDRYNIGFEKEFTPDVDESANVLGYPNEFKHIILNFFNNSRDSIVDYRERLVDAGEDISVFKGIIKIMIAIDGGTVIVKVSDTGGGIPANILNRVFVKHFSTKADQGSGIGLYMCKEMVEKSMNGTINVCNIIGGAEFTLTFRKAEKGQD